MTSIAIVRDHMIKLKVVKGSVTAATKGGMRVEVGENLAGPGEIWFATVAMRGHDLPIKWKVERASTATEAGAEMRVGFHFMVVVAMGVFLRSS